MTRIAEDMKIPPAPPAPAGGFAYVIVADPAWTLAEDGRTCRWRPGGRPGGIPPACGKPAVTQAEAPGNRLRSWREYCAEHTLAHLHWVQDGQVWTWELRRKNGSPLTRAEARLAERARRPGPGPRRADWCGQHKRPRADCPPEARHTYTHRQRGDLMAEVQRLAAERGQDLNTFVTAALEQAAGWQPPEAAQSAREAPAANGRPAGARDRAAAPGAPAVAAKDLPRPGAAPVFQAGPDVDCLHENMRIRKGVCPDCKQWVTK